MLGVLLLEKGGELESETVGSKAYLDNHNMKTGDIMKRNVWMLRLVGFCAIAAMLGTMTGCGGDGDAAEGTGTIQGTVEAFGVSAPVALVLAAAQGVTVYLDGPVSRSTTTDANGTFSFTGLPAGDYTLRFEYNGEEVTYRGQSGQEATISVADDQTVEVTDIRVSGGNVNIGNIRVLQPDGPESADSNGSDSTTNPDTQNSGVAGTWTGTVDGNSTTLRLTQNGSSVAGTMTGWPPDETCAGTHTVTGSISGNTASLHVVCPGGGDVNDWRVTVDGDVMTGDIQATRSP